MTLTPSGGSPGVEWLAGGAAADAEVRAVLRRALPAGAMPGSYVCAACLAAAHSERDCLAQIPGFLDAGGDPSLLLCAGHLTDAAMAAGRGAGLRAVVAWQADCHAAIEPRRSGRTFTGSAGKALASLRTARRRDSTADCPVCRARRQAAAGALHDVSDGLRAAPHAAHRRVTLCLRHLLSLRAADPWAGQVAARAAVERADMIIAELTEAFRKSTWTHRAEAQGPEMTAWRRAPAFLDGSVFCGCPPRLA